MRTLVVALAVGVLLASAAPARAQAAPAASPAPAAGQSAPAPNGAVDPAATICGQPVPTPASLPAAGSGPVVYLIAPCWEAQGNTTLVEPATYLYYIKLKPSQPSQNQWTPYDDAAEKQIIEDFHTLWNTNFLDNLSVSS